MSAASQPRQSRDKPKRVPLGFGGLQARVSDHIGHFFRSTDEWKSVLVPFLKAGLEGGDMCIYVTSPEAHAVADITAALAAEGIDVDRCRTTGQLILTEGRSTPQEMKALLSEAISKVSAESRLLRLGGDMTWSLKKMPGTDALMEWESHCNVVEEAPALFLCQYDLKQFLGSVVMDALKTHPLCIIGNAIHQNPYYIEPELYLEELRSRQTAGGFV